MIGSKADYVAYLEADRIALRVGRTRPRFLGDEVWRYQRRLRKTEYARNCGKGALGRVRYFYQRSLLERAAIRLGFTVGLNVFGPGLSISHRGTIVVNGKARVGANCRISNNVTIGEAPNIGDNVFIGPGAVIYGDLTIADGIAIGANSVVNKSFTTPNVTIAGAPAAVVNAEAGSNDFLVVRATELIRGGV